VFRVKFEINPLVRQFRRTTKRWDQDQRNLLDVLGTQLLNLSQLAYRAKARGGRGGDGIQWKPLKRGTLEARVRRRAPSRRIVSQRRKLADQIKRELDAHKGQRRKLRTSTKDSRQRKKLGDQSLAKRRKIQQLRNRRRELLKRHEGLVDKEVGKHEIGVDSGLQRSSASPGFVGNDGKGGNLLKIEKQRVTVGYNRTYSKHFDAKRPLFPDVPPAAWEQKLERQAQTWAEKILRDTLGGGAGAGGES